MVWFNEPIGAPISERISTALDTCDLYLIAGTSSVVMQAAFYAYQVSGRGVPVAEFNIDEKPTCEVTE